MQVDLVSFPGLFVGGVCAFGAIGRLLEQLGGLLLAYTDMSLMTRRHVYTGLSAWEYWNGLTSQGMRRNTILNIVNK